MKSGFDIKSNRRINNPIIPTVVIRPPNPSHFRAMASPIIELIGKKINECINSISNKEEKRWRSIL